MPLDTSIPLQTTSITDVANKQLQNMQQAEAARNQLQLQRYGVEQARQDFEDQQNLKKAWQAANGDPTQTVAIAGKLGVSPKALQAFQSQQLAYAKQLAELDAQKTATGKTKLDILNEKNEHLYNTIEPLLSEKDPAVYAAKLPLAIAAANQAGYLSDDDAVQAASMSQDQLRTYSTSLLNVKAHADIIKGINDTKNAESRAIQAGAAREKQTNEAASQIESGNQSKLNAAARELTNALRTAGPLGYNKKLQEYANDELITGSMPTAEQITQMKPADAFAAINDAGMTSQQRQQHADAARTAAQQAADAAETARHHQVMEAAERQRNNIEAQKFAVQFGGDAVKGWTQQVMDNPSAVEDVPAGLRNAVGLEFKKTTGSPLPTKLVGADKTNLSNARFTLGMIDQLKELAKDPEVLNGMGPIAGRLLKGQSIVGTGNTTKQQQFVTMLEYLYAGEGRTIFGGRAPQKLLTSLQHVSASASKDPKEFIGSLNGAGATAQSRIDAVIGQQFGGKVPDWYKQRLNQQTSTAPKAPPVGYIDSGYRFKGGDPSVQSNWEKVGK